MKQSITLNKVNFKKVIQWFEDSDYIYTNYNYIKIMDNKTLLIDSNIINIVTNLLNNK